MDFEILIGVVQASNDACWCMDFKTPVDLTAPDHEVVRQVFENDPFWRLSNPAMAQLYLLPAGQQFNDQPVADIFPRNAQNEEFIRNLIANGFEVDRAPALDTRYDGIQIYVENDVRAHIENGQLIRMFGTVRDIGKHQRREAELMAERDACINALNALQSAVCSVDENGTIQLANDRANTLLASDRGDIVGQNLFSLAESHSDEAFAQDLKSRFEISIRRGILGTETIASQSTDEIWGLTTGSDQEPASIIVTIDASTAGGHHG